MSTPTAQCIKRLQMELRKLALEKDTSYQIKADPQNMLHCYFVVDGPEGTPYAGGRYVGLIDIPPDYPFKPPSLQMRTPSGRFKTGMGICLSNSSYHPEQWSPMWGLRTILIALVSFFVSDEPTTGSMESSVEERRKYAANSRQFNVERLQAIYRRVLPDAYAADVAYLEKQKQKQGKDQALANTKTPYSGSDSASSSSSDDSDTETEEEQKREECEGRVSKTAKTELQNSASDAAGGRNRNATTMSSQQEDGSQKKGGKDSTSALNGEGKEAAATEERLQSAGTNKRHHHHHHRHRKFSAVVQGGGGALQLGAVPWRRWVSLAVLLAVGLMLVAQL